MDSVTFQAMAIEMDRKMAGSRLDKVTQVTAGTLALKFWTGSEKVQLLVQADGQGGFYQSTESYPAPARPPRFCQLLRARLRRLVGIVAEPCDRIAHFHFTGPQKEVYDLVFEAFGAQGNLVLLDGSGQIVDLLRRQDGVRKMLPGEAYRLPGQQPRVSLFAAMREVVPLVHAGIDQGNLSRSDLAPMSPALAQAIAAACRSGQTLEAILTRVREAFSAGSFRAQRVTWDGRQGLLPVSLGEHGFDEVAEYADLSALVAADLASEAGESARDLSARLAALISKQRKRLHKRLVDIAAESERQSDPERFRIMGDLLLASLHEVKRGAASVEVVDYYRSPTEKVKIELDPKSTPRENAERYFKLYRKARRSGEHHERRLEETEQEMEWLAQLELSLEEAVSGDDLYQVQLEMESAGLLKETKGQLARRPPARPEDQLYQAVTPGGWKLYWGKNSRSNDYVSRSMTGPQDFWFHAKGMPGSHLVLKCGDSADRVAEDDLLFAAAYAAGYSKGKAAGKVEVIVAQGRDVSKPKGARPGLVTVDSYHSVLVAPRRLES